MNHEKDTRPELNLCNRTIKNINEQRSQCKINVQI